MVNVGPTGGERCVKTAVAAVLCLDRLPAIPV